MRFLGMGLVFVGAFVASLVIGPARIGLSELVRAFTDPAATGETARVVLLELRLPRALLAAATGASLAIGGVLLQAFFQNPMAGPYVVGVSSGAGLAVAIVAALAGVASPPTGTIPLSAFVGGAGVVALVALLAEKGETRRTETLLLLGLAIAAICSAITSVILLSLSQGPEGVLRWIMGSLAAAGWGGVGLVSAALLVGTFIAVWNRAGLDAILWGDDTARSVGVEVAQLRRMILLAATIPVAASVAVGGVIGFLGLMVPHVTRGFVGPRHARLIPASILVGASWLLIADIVARMLLAPSELPVGAITSAVGAPFLVWICLRRR